MSIRLRLTLWYTSILSLTLFVFGVGLYFFLKQTNIDQFKASMESHVNEVYKRMDFSLMPSLKGWYLDFYLDDQDRFLSEGIYLQLVNLSTMEETTSRNAFENDLRIPYSNTSIDKLRSEAAFFETAQIQGHPFLVYHKRIVIDNRLVGVLQAAIYTGSHEMFLSSLRVLLIGASLVMVLFAALIGWFLARKALRPIDHVIQTTQHIQEGSDLGTRIEYSGPQDEIGQLTDTINHMLERLELAYNHLEKMYQNQRRFVSDASHELRTPLTSIRGNIDLLNKVWADKLIAKQMEDDQYQLSQESLRDIAEESERMSRLINDMLSLARADTGYLMEKSPSELEPIVEEAVRRAQFLPRQADWIVGDLSALAGVVVNGNKDYLIQLLTIFIENAFKYTPEGSVRLEAKREKGLIGIVIQDTGLGMDKDEVPQIFERFYRADLSRGMTPGTGLGLSIAKWIIGQHDGSIEVETAQGKGSIFTIWLPIAFHDAEKSGILEVPG